MEFALWGLGGAVVTSLVLQVVKQIWTKDGEPVIKDRWAVVTAIVIGVALSVLAYVGQLYPGIQGWLDVVGAGALAGLVACGLYSATKSRE